ncbi:MAG: family 16 glycoside hydrolase [Verrucomicrobiales bacterium]
MRSLLPAAVLACFLTVPRAGAEDGFRDLFNGRDLKDWKNVNCAPETWSVRDGMIHCTGKPTGALRTTRHYENFILELEWRHLKPGGNAGVFIWSGPISATGQPFLRAIEVQVLDHAYGKSDWFTTHGDVFPIHGSKMKPHGRHNGMRSFPSEERSKPSPEWNHYRIECNDGVLRLHVNGKEVSGGSECDWRKGYIALESEGSPVDFRNIRIKELPSTGATETQTAPEWDGSESIYTGTDLRGWSSPGDGWKSKDWRLTHEGKAVAGAATLWTDKKYGDCEVSFDWKRPEGTEDRVGLYLGEPGGCLFGIGDTKGKWRRATVSVKGGTAVLMIDGKEFHRAEVEVGVERKIGLFATGPAEFAGIYVRPTKK